MKKLLLTLVAAAAMWFPSLAGEKILYQQNFESVATPADAGWSYGGTSISIQTNDAGKFLELSQGSMNGRSGKVTWGTDIFFSDGKSVLENEEYNMQFDFCVMKNATDQYNSCITVFTNHTPIDNQPYRTPWQSGQTGPWDNFIFDLSQCNTAGDADMIATINAPLKDGAIDISIPYTLKSGTWYTATMHVNVNTRKVEYIVVDQSGNELTNGTMTVPDLDANEDSISMYAAGMYVMTARYNKIIDIDNIKIFVESDEDVANAPTIALSRVGTNADNSENLEMRAYTITFSEGETLHITGTDGTTTDITYVSCNGSYTYETTESGTLTAWTTLGSATSNKVEETVECSEIELPGATVTISGISEGYGKTYSLSLDNSDILLRPEITLSYEFTGESGDKVTGTGNSVTVNENGTLSVTASALGYKKSTTSIDNNVYYTVKKTWDFARMSKEEIVAAGFPEEFSKYDNSSKWVSNGALYYGNKIRPFSEIEYSLVDNSTAESVEKDQYFKDLTIFPKTSKGCPNVGMMYRIGLFNNQTINNYNNIIVHNLDQSDIVVFNVIGGYGSISCHPNVSSAEEYYAVLAGKDHLYEVSSTGVQEASENANPTYSVTYPLYRIDSACTLITVYKESDPNVKEDVATEPKVELVRVGTDASGKENLELRVYKITFLEGETLHVKDHDGNTITVEYSAENEGVYEYEATTSGSLIAWTTSGKATSEEVSRTVDCNPIALPEVKVSLTSITEGYGKTYNLTVDNKNVLLEPEISISYVFTDDKGNEVKGSESTVTVSEKGKLVVTSSAKGYQSTTTTVENNNYYAVKKMWDFARMTDEEITNAGFPEYTTLNSNSTSSGFDQWTGRKRLYYNNSGSTVYPFGFVSSTSSNVLYHSTIGSDVNVTGKELFPGIRVYAGHNVRYMKHIGMVNDETSGGNDKNIDVLELDAADIVVINKISSYGSNSNHPDCSTDEEYYAQLTGSDTFYKASEGSLNSETGKYSVSCPVYRIDTAATEVTVYSEVDLTADYAYTVEYVNELTGEVIKTAPGEGKFGTAIVLSEEDTADFNVGDVKYTVVSNDSEGKTVSLVGTTVTITCHQLADYTLKYVDVDGDVEIQTVIKSGKVESEIELTKEDTAEFEKDGITYIYDEYEPENPKIGVDGKTVVTLKFHKKAEVSYTVRFVDQDGNKIKEDDTTRIGDAGKSVTITDEDKEDIEFEGATYEYAGDNTDGLKYEYDGSTEVVITYNKVVNYTIKFVDESGTEIKTAETYNGAIGSEITLPDDYQDPIYFDGQRYNYVSNNLDSNPIITADGTTVTITYHMPVLGDENIIVDQTFDEETELTESADYALGSDIKNLIKTNGIYMTNGNAKSGNYENRDFITFANPIGAPTQAINVSYNIYNAKGKGQALTYFDVNYFNANGDFVFGIREGIGGINGTWSYPSYIITANEDGTKKTTQLPDHLHKLSGDPSAGEINLNVKFSDVTSIIEIDGNSYSAYNTSANIKSIMLTVSGDQDHDRGLYIKDFVVKTTEVEAITTAEYTINYEYGNEILKTETKTAEIGSKITITEEQKKPIFNEGKTAKYIYAGDDAEKQEVTADGNTVVTITFRDAEKWSYTVTNKVNSDEKKGSVLEGESATVAFSRYILENEGTVWEKVPGKSSPYTISFTPDKNNYETELEYTATDITDGIFFSEAENIDGMTYTDNNNANVHARCSNAAGGYAEEAVTLYTLPAGTYKVRLGVWGNAGNTFVAKAGEEIVLSEETQGYWFEAISEEFTVDTETALTFEGANASKPLDYVLITGTMKEAVKSVVINEASVVKTLTIGDTYKLTATVVSDNSSSDPKVTWTTSDAKVATVDNAGNVRVVKAGKVTITATYGGKSASCTLKCYPKVGDANWDGKFDITDAVDISNYVVGKKVADSNWDEAEWTEFYKTGANTNNDEEGNITFADASAAVSIALTQQPTETPSQSRIIAAYDNDDQDALVIGGISAANGRYSIPVTLDNTMEYVALQADIILPEGMNVEVKEGSRVADSHIMATHKFADNHIRVALYNLGNTAFAENNAPIIEIIADGMISDNEDIAIFNIIAADTDANRFVLASKAAETTGVAALGFDSDAPVKVYDLNGRYISDKIEGLEQGFYIIRQGNNAKKVRIR